MMQLCRGLAPTMLGALLLSATAAAQGLPNPPPANQGQPPVNPGQPAANPGPASNPVCVRLESQLATMDRGSGEAARADQIKRSEDAVAKQQAELDRAVAQSRRTGCEEVGFFSLFSGRSAQCGPITAQIQQMRGNLDRMMSDLERLRTGNVDQDGQRRALIGLLAQNNCGSQYSAAANSTAGPRGFFDALFGNGTIVNPNGSGGDGAPAGTYRTVCVRTCDGFYFPISYSTVPSKFADDQRSCQRLCPASDAVLYSYRNPGEGMDQAVSMNGQPYTALPAAFQYRKEFTAACSCRRPGQTWGEALKNADDSSTVESGDILVNEQKAKALSQAPQQGTPAKPPQNSGPPPDASPAPAAAAAPDATPSDPSKRTVRTVGPPFVAR